MSFSHSTAFITRTTTTMTTTTTQSEKYQQQQKIELLFKVNEATTTSTLENQTELKKKHIKSKTSIFNNIR